MNVTVVLEHRFVRTRDGAVWTDGPFGYSFFTRYRSEFDTVRVAARVRDADRALSGWRRADGKGVCFQPLPHYVGPWGYLTRWLEFQRAAARAVGPTDAVILRVPSQAAICVERSLRLDGRPYGLEVVGDPLEAFSPRSHSSAIRTLARRHHYRQLREQCRNACAVAYVTAEALQRRYPACKFTTHYSSIELPEDAFIAGPRAYDRWGGRARLITIGSLEHLYKGPDILVQAVARCIDRGLDIEVVLVGDGRRCPELERVATELGLRHRTIFKGQVPAGPAVRAELDKADLFVLPSRQEGLPRAMIEAMARGLPCVGSDVGGIPELLPSDVRVPAGDSHALAEKIGEIVQSPVRLRSMAAHNFEKAKHYREELLRPRRDRFYRYLREQTTIWLEAYGRKTNQRRFLTGCFRAI